MPPLRAVVKSVEDSSAVLQSAMRSFKEGFRSGWAMWWSPFAALGHHFRLAAKRRRNQEPDQTGECQRIDVKGAKDPSSR